MKFNFDTPIRFDPLNRIFRTSFNDPSYLHEKTFFAKKFDKTRKNKNGKSDFFRKVKNDKQKTEFPYFRHTELVYFP